MNQKYFIIDPSKCDINKEDLDGIHAKSTSLVNNIWSTSELKRGVAIKSNINLKAPIGRVVIKIDTQYKNQVSFNGGMIRLERQFNELNRRITEPVNAFVIDAENIPEGAEVLIHHNCLHDVNRVFDCEDLVEGEVATDVKYYSIKENECFLWRKDSTEWQPCTVFATALRVFKPYTGVLENIPHTLIKDTLYVTSGELKGKCVATIKSADYEVIFQNEKGVEERVIRFRPFGDKENEREEEAIAVMDELTYFIENGIYFVGLNAKDCKPLNT